MHTHTHCIISVCLTSSSFCPWKDAFCEALKHFMSSCFVSQFQVDDLWPQCSLHLKLSVVNPCSKRIHTHTLFHVSFISFSCPFFCCRVVLYVLSFLPSFLSFWPFCVHRLIRFKATWCVIYCTAFKAITSFSRNIVYCLGMNGFLYGCNCIDVYVGLALDLVFLDFVS